jgi:nicotinamide-nucleotide amidase
MGTCRPDAAMPDSRLPVAVVATGNELLDGRAADTNLVRAARLLAPAGARIVFHVTARDDIGAIADAIRLARPRARVLIVSGGLGPTRDDVTREAVSAVARRPLVEHGPSLVRLARRLPRATAQLAIQRRQALVPRGAVVFPNPAGSAAGFALRLQGCWCVVLPGVPREFDAMLSRVVLPWLHRRGLLRRPAFARALTFCGVPESVADDAIDRLGIPLHGLEIALTVHEGIVKIVLTSREGEARPSTRGRDAAQRILELHRALRRRFGEFVVSAEGRSLEETVARLLGRRGWTVAVAESCTGGRVARLLTSVPGISASFLEAVVSYSNRSKIRRLGVPAASIRRHGAVSVPVAEAMARGAARTAGADVGLGVTGIAGPGGGTPEKPVGLVCFAAWARGRVETAVRRFRGDRMEVQERAAVAALDLLRRMIV